jgi:hypothetical protein
MISGHFLGDLYMDGRFFKRWALLAVLGAALLVGGCGGSSSDSSAVVVTPGMGKVALLVTDAPTEDFDHILMSFDQVTLLGDGGQVGIYPQSAGDGEITIDLLALREVADLAFIRDVPAGTYSKMRLHVTGIDLVKGDVHSPVDLAANGKVDLNPQGDFQIMAGQTLFIQLDIDANRSFQAHQSGNGSWHFRPVVFMDIFGDFRRLVRIHGDVNGTALDSDPASFDLTQTAIVSEQNGGTGMAAGSGDTVRVYPGDAGVFSDVDGTDQGIAAIQLTEPLMPLTAIGYFRSHLGLADGDIAEFDAVVIELGGPDAFLRVSGMALDAPADDGLGTQVFDWVAAPGQDVAEGTVLTTQLQAKTRVFDNQGREYSDGSVIVPGVTGRVDGIADGDLFRSSLVVLDQEQLAGAVSAIVDPLQFTLAVPDVGEALVCAAAAQLLKVEVADDGLGGTVTTVSQADFAELAVGQSVEVSGQTGATCFDASLVIMDLTPI